MELPVKWSWKIARIAGIDVRLHVTFVILIAWIALVYWKLFGTLYAVLSSVSFILALFGCVLLHELGHALTARKFDIRTSNITLLPIGGVAQVEKMPADPRKEILIALAGPAVSMVIALLLWVLLSTTSGLVPLQDLSVTGGSFLQRLMIINFLLAAFNLLPALPMDGGRVFRALLTLKMEPVTATRIAAGLAQMLAILLALLGLRYNLFLVFIAIFIWFGAVAEASMANLKSALSGISARSAMLKDFQVIEAGSPLSRAVELTLSGSQKHFPVMAGNRIAGVLNQSDLLRGLHDHGKTCLVEQVMQPEVQTADVSEGLEVAMEKLQQQGSGLLIITENDKLAGIIDVDNILELLKFQKALREHDEQHW